MHLIRIYLMNSRGRSRIVTFPGFKVILLDYLIDQEEDRINGDLNFCFITKNNDEMIERFQHFIQMQRKAFLNYLILGFIN